MVGISEKAKTKGREKDDLRRSLQGGGVFDQP
jgi:hypothetical protein